ncbi:MAG: hypothetical protein MUF77_08835 [Leptospira sp.]|nr:hypothetical protein [Leptospira sp.]
MKNSFTVLSILLSIFLAGNCISFRSGEHKNTAKISSFGLPKNISVKLNNTYQRLTSGEPGFSNPIIAENWKDNSAKILNESGDVFSTRSETEANFIFDIKAVQEDGYYSANISPWLSILTLGVYPHYAKYNISLTIGVKDKKGNLLGEVKKEETLTEIGQIIFLFTLPFSSPTEVYDEQKRDLISSAYAEIKEKGLLKLK